MASPSPRKNGWWAPSIASSEAGIGVNFPVFMDDDVDDDVDVVVVVVVVREGEEEEEEEDASTTCVVLLPLRIKRRMSGEMI